MNHKNLSRLLTVSLFSALCLALLRQPALTHSPVDLTIPSVAITTSDQPLVLSTAGYDAIALTGLDATDSVTLSLSTGTLSLTQTTGLTFSAGDGIDDATMTFTGSEAEANAALDGLTVTPPAGFAGRITLSIEAGDAAGTLKIAVNHPFDGEAARNTILDGVTQIHNAVQPGNLAAIGDTAFLIGHHSDGNGWIAASSYGQGRVLAMSDHQSLNMGSYGDQADGAAFYKNSIAWLAGTTALTPTIVVHNASAATWLTGEGFTDVTSVNTSGLAAALDTAASTGSGQADIYIGWPGSNLSESDRLALQDFALNGGHLMIADYGVGYDWWWNKPHYDGSASRLLREAGIVYGGGFRYYNGVADIARATGQMNADAVLALLADPSGATEDEKSEAGLALIQMFDGLPPGDPLLQQLDTQFAALINTINPTPDNPVGDPFEQAMLTRESTLLQQQDVYEVTAHRTVTDVYGAIPSDAPRISQTVGIDTSKTRFQFTGLYAAPGEVVTVTVPAELVGEGYLVRINTNTDNISPRPQWMRLPVVHRSFPIESSVVPVASAFGGSIIIDLRGGTYGDPANIGIQNVTIENAVEQPYFVLGTHTNADWLNGLRDKPAVRAVLVSEHKVFTVPSSYVADIEDPETLMTWWDDVVAGQDDLVGRHEPRTTPEITNVDRQNSAGSAHAGYPIQAWDIYWGDPTDSNLLQTGSWGDFHEIGHNHQRGWWTFDGDTEVSVNIFANFNLETDPSAPGPNGWGYSLTEATSITRAKSDVAGGGTYSDKESRWSFWFLLADVNGWEPYRCAFRTYEDDNANNPDALPDTNEEEQAQWLVRFSLCAGYDMSPFMVDQWGLEVDQTSLDAVAHLPKYMPVAGGITEETVASGEMLPLDFAGTAITMDDVVTVTAVAMPQNGTLTDNGSGSYTYQSDYEYVGTETLTYTLQTSAGNIKTYTATIAVTLGGAQLETWRGIAGTDVADLRADARFPNSPDEVELLDQLDAPVGRGSDFGSRLRAVLVPTVTGDYTFWIASDDDGELWLSPNTDPHAATLIASVDGHTGWYEWDKYPSQQSVTQPLVAGERYYLEALMKENSGADNLSVAWSGGGLTDTTVIDGTFVQPVELGDAPAAGNDLGATDEDTPVTIVVLTNDSDPESDPLVVGTAQAGNGTVAIQLDGSLVYTPSADFNGTTLITYTIADKYASSDTGIVTVTVNAVNDAPRGDDSTFELYRGSANGTAVGSVNAVDPDSDPLTAMITDGDSDGIFGVDNTGAISVVNGAMLTDTVYTLTVALFDGVLTTTVTARVEVFGCDDPLVVSSSADSGPCTLRHALANSSHDDKITFHPRLAGATIAVESQLMITANVTIDGGAAGITLDGQNQTHMAQMGNYRTVHFQNLNFVNGRSNYGALYVTWWGHAVISNTTFANNTNTYWGGGAIHSQSTVSTYNSTFSGNHSTRYTGAIHASRTSTFVNTTFFNNTDANGNGSLNINGGEWTLHNTIISSTTGTACSGSTPAASSGNLTFDATCAISTTRGVVSNFGLSSLTKQGATWVHIPEAGSPAIDGGDNAHCLATDQIGTSRDDGMCDIGAIELAEIPTAVVVRASETVQQSRILLLFALFAVLSFGIFAMTFGSRNAGR